MAKQQNAKNARICDPQTTSEAETRTEKERILGQKVQIY